MFRILAAALFLALLTACTVPAETAVLPPTENAAPPVNLATFTPVAADSPAPTEPATRRPIPSPAPSPTPTRLSNFWEMLFPGADITRTDDGLIALRHAPNLVQYGVLFEGNPEKARQLSQWLDEAPRAQAGVNCGFYWDNDGEFVHMGLLEVDGRRLAPVRPDWGSALVVRDGRAQVVRTPSKRIPPMTFGVQGWPTLLWRRELVAELAAIDSGDMARRTAVGVDDTGRVLWIVDNLGSTLPSFAYRLQQADLGLVDVVNLDGGASTGLRWRAAPGEPQTGVDSLPIPCAITLSPMP